MKGSATPIRKACPVGGRSTAHSRTFSNVVARSSTKVTAHLSVFATLLLYFHELQRFPRRSFCSCVASCFSSFLASWRPQPLPPSNQSRQERNGSSNGEFHGNEEDVVRAGLHKPGPAMLHLFQEATNTQHNSVPQSNGTFA